MLVEIWGVRVAVVQDWQKYMIIEYLDPWGYPRDLSTQIIPTLGPKVYRYYLHWAIWIPKVMYAPTIKKAIVGRVLHQVLS